MSERAVVVHRFSLYHAAALVQACLPLQGNLQCQYF